MSCSSFPYALFVVNSLFNSSQYKNALVVSSEIYSNFIKESDNSTNLIFSDGSTSSFIQKVSNNNLLSYDFGHDGSNFDKIKLNKNMDNSNLKLYSNNLNMMGSDVFQFTMNKIPISINSLQKKSKVKDIDLFFTSS